MKRSVKLLVACFVVALLVTVASVAAVRKASQPTYKGMTATQWILEYGAATRRVEIWIPRGGSTIIQKTRIPSLPTTNSWVLRTNSLPPWLPPLGRFPREHNTNQEIRAFIMAAYHPDKDPAIQAIRKIGPSAIPYLTNALVKQDTLIEGWQRKLWPKMSHSWRTNIMSPPKRLGDYHRNAAAIIGRLGTNAVPAIPALNEAANSKDPYIRNLAADALNHLRIEGVTK